jgi:hypothetical protein
MCNRSHIRHSDLLSYAIYYSLKMACRNDRHDRRVDHSQILGAVHKQLWIHDSSQIKRQHGASTTWVELCLYVGLDELQDFLIRSVWSGIELKGFQQLHRCCIEHLTVVHDRG